MARFTATVEFDVDINTDAATWDRAEEMDVENALRTELQVAIEASMPQVRKAMQGGLRAQNEHILLRDLTPDVAAVDRA